MAHPEDYKGRVAKDREEMTAKILMLPIKLRYPQTPFAESNMQAFLNLLHEKSRALQIKTCAVLGLIRLFTNFYFSDKIVRVIRMVNVMNASDFLQQHTIVLFASELSFLMGRRFPTFLAGIHR